MQVEQMQSGAEIINNAEGVSIAISGRMNQQPTELLLKLNWNAQSNLLEV